jgi:hypothetical protein
MKYLLTVLRQINRLKKESANPKIREVMESEGHEEKQLNKSEWSWAWWCTPASQHVGGCSRRITSSRSA